MKAKKHPHHEDEDIPIRRLCSTGSRQKTETMQCSPGSRQKYSRVVDDKMKRTDEVKTMQCSADSRQKYSHAVADKMKRADEDEVETMQCSAGSRQTMQTAKNMNAENNADEVCRTVSGLTLGEGKMKSTKLFKWMTLGEASLIKFLDAQLKSAAQGPFSPYEQDVDLVSLECCTVNTLLTPGSIYKINGLVTSTSCTCQHIQT